MRGRILALRRLCANPQYNIIRRASRGADEEECDAHMNELPIPCGPWEPWYRDKQAFYNKVLIFGATWSKLATLLKWLVVIGRGCVIWKIVTCKLFVFSFGMMIYTNSIFLNFGPPLQPGPPSDQVEECDDADS